MSTTHDDTQHTNKTTYLKQTIPTSQQQSVSQQTRTEHGNLLIAMHRLEAALGSPAPGREDNWEQRVARELKLLADIWRHHVASAECDCGLYSELFAARPEVALRIDELRNEHKCLEEFITSLSRSLLREVPVVEFAATRKYAAELLTGLRSHHAKEVDLIFECFWTDLGVGD